jgi:hypothetical protein
VESKRSRNSVIVADIHLVHKRKAFGFDGLFTNKIANKMAAIRTQKNYALADRARYCRLLSKGVASLKRHTRDEATKLFQSTRATTLYRNTVKSRCFKCWLAYVQYTREENALCSLGDDFRKIKSIQSAVKTLCRHNRNRKRNTHAMKQAVLHDRVRAFVRLRRCVDFKISTRERNIVNRNKGHTHYMINTFKRLRENSSAVSSQYLNSLHSVTLAKEHYLRSSLRRFCSKVALARGLRITAAIEFGNAGRLARHIRSVFDEWREWCRVERGIRLFNEVSSARRCLVRLGENVVRGKKHKRDCRVAATFYNGIILLKTFCNWCSYTDYVVKEREYDSLIRSFVVRKYWRLLSAVVVRRSGRRVDPNYIKVVSGVFDHWTCYNDLCKAKKYVIEYGERHRVERVCRDALRVLRSNAVNERSVNRRYGVASVHCKMTSCKKCFERWRYNVVKAKYDRGRDVWAGEYYSCYRVKRGFDCLRNHARASVEEKKKEWKSKELMRRKDLAVCFTLWRDSTHANVHKRSTVRRAVDAMYDRKLYDGMKNTFVAWKDVVRECVQRRILFNVGFKRDLFCEWRDVVVENKRRVKNVLRVIVFRWSLYAKACYISRNNNRKALANMYYVTTEKHFRAWYYWYANEKECRIVETEKYIKRRVNERLHVASRAGVDNITSLVGTNYNVPSVPTQSIPSITKIVPVASTPKPVQLSNEQQQDDAPVWKPLVLEQPRRPLEILVANDDYNDVNQSQQSTNHNDTSLPIQQQQQQQQEQQQQQQRNTSGIPEWIVEEMNKRFANDYSSAIAQTTIHPTVQVHQHLAPTRQTAVEVIKPSLYANGPPWKETPASVEELPNPRWIGEFKEVATDEAEDFVQAEPMPLLVNESNESNLTSTTASSASQFEEGEEGEDDLHAPRQVQEQEQQQSSNLFPIDETGETSFVETSTITSTPLSPPRLAFRIQTESNLALLSPMSATSVSKRDGADIAEQLQNLEGKLLQISQEKARRKGTEGFAAWKEKTRPKLQKVLSMIEDIKNAQAQQIQQEQEQEQQ